MRIAYCRPGTDAWPTPDGPPPDWIVAPFSDAAALEEGLRDRPFDAALVRLLSDPSLLTETMSRLRAAAPGLPTVVAAEDDQEADAAAAVAAGAADYWLETMSAQRLRTSLERAALSRRASAPRGFLESILNSVADPIIVKDREHRYLLLNDAACVMLGRPREELLGRTVRELVPIEQAEVFLRQDDLVFETGRENVNEELFTDAAGVTHLLITKKTLGRDADGRPVLVSAIRDVTEKMKSIEDLKRSQEQLQHSQKLEAVGRLAGGVAHDFNNILTAIIGCAGILLESLPPGHSCREDADEIRRAGERAASLTSQLLTFTRREDALPRILDLREVYGEMRKMLQRILPAGIELDLSIPERLGLVSVDQGQAEQVLLNLVVNAGDAMPDGGRVRVALADAPDGGGGLSGPCVRLSVADTGVGMDESTRARIFEPFFTTKSSGVGLGLATVRDAIARGGGAVDVESEPGRGATFRVYWPRAAGAAPASGSDVPAGGRRASRPARVLVVEDDDIVRRFIVRCLEREGHMVMNAADGAEALRISDAHEDSFDAVVMDMVLPRGRGTEIAVRLRARQPAARVLFVSGYRTEESALPSGPDGSVRFLAKPFTGAALADKVRELLEPA